MNWPTWLIVLVFLGPIVAWWTVMFARERKRKP